MATWSVLLVRHASAGDREMWEGPDELRPLDSRGRRQADALVEVARSIGALRLISADVLRCQQTLAPTAVALGLPIEPQHALSEDGYWVGPERSHQVWKAILATGTSVAVCSQGGAIPDLVGRTLAEFGTSTDHGLTTKKGDYWHFRCSSGPTIVEVGYHPNPARRV